MVFTMLTNFSSVHMKLIQRKVVDILKCKTFVNIYSIEYCLTSTKKKVGSKLNVLKDHFRERCSGKFLSRHLYLIIQKRKSNFDKQTWKTFIKIGLTMQVEKIVCFVCFLYKAGLSTKLKHLIVLYSLKYSIDHGLLLTILSTIQRCTQN